MTSARLFPRRRFLQGLGVAAGVGALTPGLLAGCSSGDDSSAGGSPNEVRISNWPLYIDRDTVPDFERQTGIRAVYTEDIDDNRTFYERVEPNLAAGKSIDRDLVTPTNWMAVRMRDAGYLQRLPAELIPNAKHLNPDIQMPWDPAGEWMLPWTSGITGIAYNRDAAGRDIGSFRDLLDPAFRGRIGMLTEMRDTVGLALLAVGRDPQSVSFDDAAPAFDLLTQAKEQGQIAEFTGNEYPDKLASGRFAACMAWSGDVAQMSLENPAIRFVIPEEGGLLYSDVMCIPAFGANTATAAAWINYVYDPVVAARIAAAINYISPVAGVREVLAGMGGETARLADSPLMFPDPAALSRLRVFRALSEGDEARFDQRFALITGE
ncbi:ABC transporter substrate-binding protein [Skermania piniformis]|uniref:Spermidine/putrescine ABC transporter substrate-binding protein n=1 Tax=Skermania pinensis TaxID=39122 RepID=A0ABX8S9U5_9ACTN|nr:spermidine/putrescine ABC transporter substrate-binding protein [Skermania piniformis]QXQ14076.1 spermidine/putrescine ABC transporter substrate-binding protein [Skermania piniformis]